MKRKWLNAPAEIKAVQEGEANYITGYASVFGNIDSYDDIVQPGAFTKTIKERVPQMLVKLLDSHNWGESKAVLGTVIEAREDARGLWFKAAISTTASAQEILTKVKEGHLNRLSIGYDAVKDRFDRETGIRYLDEVRLWEISVVPFAANEEAIITDAKAARETSRIDDLEGKVKELEETIKSLTAEPVKPLTEGDSQDTEPETPAEPVSPLTGYAVELEQAKYRLRLNELKNKLS